MVKKNGIKKIILQRYYMNIKEKIIELLNLNNGSKYAIVTKNASLLDSIGQLIKENTDVVNASSRVYGVVPMGILALPGDVKIIFYDSSTTEVFLKTYLKDLPVFKFDEQGNIHE